MENNQPSLHNETQAGSKFDRNQLVSRIWANWYWFLMAAIAGITLAFIYNKDFPRNYKASMAILVRDEPHQLAMASMLDNLEVKVRNTKVQNELAILSSYSLQVKTLFNLNWTFSWYRTGLFDKKDLYDDAPYQVTVPEERKQPTGIPITIKASSASDYIASCDYQENSEGMFRTIQFREQGAFGKPFSNKYFHFTLTATGSRPAVPGTEYQLEFNDLHQMAQDYQMRLEVKTGAAESDLLSVELKGPNVQRDVDYLNELGTTYLEFGLEEKNRLAKNKLEFIKAQISVVADSLEYSGNQVTNFRAKNKIVDLGQEGTLALKKVEDVETQENALKMKIGYYSTLTKSLNDEGQLKSLVAPAEAGIAEPSLNNLLLKLNDQFSRREVLANTLQPVNPKMIAANQEIEYTQRAIRESVGNLLSNAEADLKRIEDERQKVNSRLSGIPKNERDLLNIKRGFDLNNQLYNYLLQKSAEAGIALASNDPDARILDAASPENTEVITFKPAVNLLLGLIIALLIPLLVIVIAAYSDNKLRKVEFIDRGLDLSVAGKILHNKSGDPLPVIQYPYSSITESFRNLRTNLQFLLEEAKGKVIAVHSPIQGEGKSFLSANLASIMAMSDKKVLLIDANTRNPGLSGIFPRSNEKGLGDYLKGNLSFGSILTDTEITGLTFIRAGEKYGRMSELLNSAKMKQLIGDAGKLYDYIIIDNAPADMLSDARIIASYADLNLFVLRLNYSSGEELTYLNQTAKEGVIKNMVVVLNDVKERRGRRRRSEYFDEGAHMPGNR